MLHLSHWCMTLASFQASCLIQIPYASHDHKAKRHHESERIQVWIQKSWWGGALVKVSSIAVPAWNLCSQVTFLCRWPRLLWVWCLQFEQLWFLLCSRHLSCLVLLAKHAAFRMEKEVRRKECMPHCHSRASRFFISFSCLPRISSCYWLRGSVLSNTRRWEWVAELFEGYYWNPCQSSTTEQLHSLHPFASLLP